MYDKKSSIILGIFFWHNYLAAAPRPRDHFLLPRPGWLHMTSCTCLPVSALLPKLSKIDGTSVSDMHASMFLIVAGRLFAPPWSLSVHEVEDGEAMQVAAEKIGNF